MEIVPRKQGSTQNLFAQSQMMDVTTRIVFTSVTGAFGIDWACILLVAGVRIFSWPMRVNAWSVRPDRVGRTQSNISIPRITAPTRSAGFPTPIKYRGLSTGKCGVVSSKTLNIISWPSPTAKPPNAYPSNSISLNFSADSRRNSG